MNKEILRLAIPNILSNISAPLISSVDTALMGQLSEVHLAAVGLGGIMFNVMYWNFVFLRMGTTGITAQAYGRDDQSAKYVTLYRAIFLAFIVALVLVLFQDFLLWGFLFLFNASDSVEPYVTTYFSIRIWAVPANLGIYAVFGWFFGLQNAWFPLIITIVVNVVNIGFNFFFVYYMGMEIEGVAWGTVIAQYTGLFLGVLLIVFRYKPARIRGLPIFEWNALKAFLKINSDIFLRTISLTIAYGFFYSRSAAYGDRVLAVNTIVMQFLTWKAYAIDGFAFAAESLVGKYVGRKNYSQSKEAIRRTMIWGLGFALLFSLVYWAFGIELARIFTGEEKLVQAFQGIHWLVAVMPLIAFGSYMWDGIYVGLTAGKAMRNSMALALITYLIFHFLILFKFGLAGLIIGLMIFLFTRAGYQWWMYKKWNLLEKAIEQNK